MLADYHPLLYIPPQSVGKNGGKMLTAQQTKHLAKIGRHHDGRGLYLNITATGSRSWVQRITVDGRRRDIGLGPFPAVTLAQARRKAEANRAAVADGRDPLAEKRRAATPTFREAAHAVHEANLPRWRSAKHAASWMQTLERHAMPTLGAMRLDRIRRADVLAVLTPIWTTRPETARRVRQRIRTVLKWAQAYEYVENNAAGEAIDGALPPQPKVKAHLRALHYLEVPVALTVVDATRASQASRLCLRFAVLTAARPGEALGALWSEINLDGREWRIPGVRMKAGAEHRVPLSDAALEVLDAAKVLYDGSDYVFPSPVKPGRPLSNMTLTKVLRDCGLAERATVHGFRSSFRTWALEQTDAPWAVAEAALAHTVGDSTQQAYVRGDLFDRRRELMTAWAGFLDDC